MHSVLIIDDHDIVRFGLETLVGARSDLALAGSASSLSAGLELISQRSPDLVITDMALEDSKGLETVRAVVAAQGERATLVISMHDELLYGEQVLALGASGYIMKETAHAVVIEAAQTVLSGQRWVSPRLNAKLLNKLLERGRPPSERPGGGARSLTLRELEVLEMLRTGKTTKEIAFTLNLSTRTVDIHRASIKKKLGLRSGSELIAYASTKT